MQRDEMGTVSLSQQRWAESIAAAGSAYPIVQQKSQTRRALKKCMKKNKGKHAGF